ncbi:hypothetical protein P9199_16445 [Geobacillus stearothermophilus]|nr:hypothetical protein [Geobacillus stearothermophilus]
MFKRKMIQTISPILLAGLLSLTPFNKTEAEINPMNTFTAQIQEG